MQEIEWGEFTFRSIFNRIAQGRRLKKEDQTPGSIPFVMAGFTNTGVINYVSNPVASFPRNSITIDIFGNVFYRDYVFGAGDDTGVYWNSNISYTKEAMLFFAVAMRKFLEGKYSYGKKLRSSQSLDFKMKLPVKGGEIDFDFINSFIAELETERIKELETERIKELEAYLKVTGLDDYILNEAEQKALDELSNIKFEAHNVTDIFKIKNTHNILSSEITANSGDTPYLCASAENNAVDCYISYDENLLEQGNCIFIGGKTFVVSYQEKDFFSNDSHNLMLSLKDNLWNNKLTQLYLVTCIRKSLSHKYSWGDSVSNKKIQKDIVFLPTINNKVDYNSMANLISAIQKLVIKDVVLYAERKSDAYNKVVNKTNNDEIPHNIQQYKIKEESNMLAAENIVERSHKE